MGRRDRRTAPATRREHHLTDDTKGTTVTTATTHKFQADDIVNLTPPKGDNPAIDYGTVLGPITRAEYERARDYYGDVEGDGPLYVVNVGNVHSDIYEYAYAESELSLRKREGWTPLPDHLARIQAKHETTTPYHPDPGADRRVGKIVPNDWRTRAEREHKPMRAGDEAEWAYEAAYAELPQDTQMRLQGSPLDWDVDAWRFTREYGSIGSAVDRECDAALAFLAIARVPTIRHGLADLGSMAADTRPPSAAPF